MIRDRNANSKAPYDASNDADASLVAQARHGDLSAMTEIMESYQRRVFGICYRMVSHYDDAADLTQEALIKVLTNLERFDGRAAFSTWVIRIAMNISLSHLRKEKRQRATFQATGSAGPSRAGENSLPPVENRSKHSQMREPHEASGVEQEEENERLNRCLTKIGDESRALLILRDIQGLEYRQIAEVLGIPIGTVKSRIFRARLAFRKVFEQSEPKANTNNNKVTTLSNADSSRPHPSQTAPVKLNNEADFEEAPPVGSRQAKEE